MPAALLPSLRGLQALQALARAGTLTAAATDLGVTRSALSHRLAELDRALGVALVEKRGRGLVPTEDGLAMLAAMGDALDRIHAAVAPLQRRRTHLRLSTVATFATHWLIPRLPAFQARHPRIEIILSTTTRMVDLSAEDIDGAIRHGHGVWPGLTARLLFRETLIPVAVPGLAARPGRGAHGGRLAGLPLIQTRSRYRDWGLWWARTGQPGLLPAPALVVETRSQALEAALAGAGVALTDMAYLDRPRAEGRLHALAEAPLALDEGYYFVHREAPRHARLVEALGTWLMAAAAGPSRAGGSAENRSR